MPWLLIALLLGAGCDPVRNSGLPLDPGWMAAVNCNRLASLCKPNSADTPP